MNATHINMRAIISIIIVPRSGPRIFNHFLIFPVVFVLSLSLALVGYAFPSNTISIVPILSVVTVFPVPQFSCTSVFKELSVHIIFIVQLVLPQSEFS